MIAISLVSVATTFRLVDLTSKTFSIEFCLRIQPQLTVLVPSKTFQSPEISVMNQTVGPRVCVDEKGDVIVDSNSLIKSQQFEVNEEVQEDDFFGWSPSYPKIKRMTSPKWMHSEDELFFSVGSDFDLMHQFFPSRSRDQLKLKFKKEEKKNERRVSEALAKPSLLNKRVINRTVRTLTERIRNELREQKSKRLKR
ncbi:Transcription factor TFIIIB component B''-like protein [Aphelenchoides besseyi]|nr:Transcription factor TFIIIB component B''-like protein [Aphelenchoides besseyi]